MDEPLALIKALRLRAAEHATSQEWTTIYMSMIVLEERLGKLQQPKPR